MHQGQSETGTICCSHRGKGRDRRILMIALGPLQINPRSQTQVRIVRAWFTQSPRDAGLHVLAGNSR